MASLRPLIETLKQGEANMPETSPWAYPSWQGFSRILDRIEQHIQTSKDHLDFGCGKSAFIAKILNDELTTLKSITAYDPCIQKTRTEGRLTITNALEGKYDSASCSCVLHETDPKNAIKEIREALKGGGKLEVVDYNLSHLRKKENGKEIFDSMFCSPTEREEKAEEGSFEKHTAYGIEACVKDLEDAGFSIEETGEEAGKYFYILARKS